MFSYTWNDLIQVTSVMAKGMPLSGNGISISPQICDFVSSDMFNQYPWKQTIANTANGTIPLIDSTQDYPCSAPNIRRLVKAWIIRTDETPNEARDLDVVNDLSVDLYPRSYVAIRAVSLQQSIGLFRLESAVNIPTGVQIELRCDYQINPIKITSLSQVIWFDDTFAHVAQKGLLYWMYKLGDDSRAGSAQTDSYGRIIGYGGQLGEYKAALNEMKMAEDYGFTQSVFPSDPMGLPRDSNSLNIFGW
mgnify:CR=1 FL=1